ncbi:MAG: molybdenum cofactor guanylyltransferase [Candidatus Limnocylindrales bacterium]
MTVGDPFSVLVLAGGASRRMGTDKRAVPIEGTPMLLRTIERLAGLPVMLAIDPRDPPNVPLPAHVRVIPDSRPGEGPLAALEAGLAALTVPTVLVVAADMPWVEPSVLRLLARRLASHAEVDVACLADSAGPRPLPLAVRRAATLAHLTSLLDTGERRLRALLPGAAVIPPDEWRPLDPRQGTLRDVDVPADLATVP